MDKKNVMNCVSFPSTGAMIVVYLETYHLQGQNEFQPAYALWEGHARKFLGNPEKQKIYQKTCFSNFDLSMYAWKEFIYS